MYFKTCIHCGAHLDPGESCDCRDKKDDAAPLQRERHPAKPSSNSLADRQPDVKLQKFYFTYGTGGQPFFGGWTEVEAPDIHAACAAFRAYHPDKTAGLLNCSSMYDEEHFKQTEMYRHGNFGYRCHETIILRRMLRNNRKELSL